MCTVELQEFCTRFPGNSLCHTRRNKLFIEYVVQAISPQLFAQGNKVFWVGFRVRREAVSRHIAQIIPSCKIAERVMPAAQEDSFFAAGKRCTEFLIERKQFCLVCFRVLPVKLPMHRVFFYKPL